MWCKQSLPSSTVPRILLHKLIVALRCDCLCCCLMSPGGVGPSKSPTEVSCHTPKLIQIGAYRSCNQSLPVLLPCHVFSSTSWVLRRLFLLLSDASRSWHTTLILLFVSPSPPPPPHFRWRQGPHPERWLLYWSFAGGEGIIVNKRAEKRLHFDHGSCNSITDENEEATKPWCRDISSGGC